MDLFTLFKMIVTGKRGSSTIEYVTLIPAVVALAMILNSVTNSGGVQTALRDRVSDAIGGVIGENGTNQEQQDNKKDIESDQKGQWLADSDDISKGKKADTLEHDSSDSYTVQKTCPACFVWGYRIYKGLRGFLSSAGRLFGKESAKKAAKKGAEKSAKKGAKKGSKKGKTPNSEFGKNGWGMQKGGAEIGGRKYTEHALERMAPNTPQVRAELERRALKKGLKPGTKRFKEYIDPRGIPPRVVEDTIKNGKRVPGNTKDTWKYIGDDINVITNKKGDVITVIPK
ncbi:DUF4244 domain-containing protein [Paludifilum halophilum]|uniref:Pre-toxin TG domain-containing protein n=1 Tax=Paludifilum halophilum TaxID=1642702 RepID=A0A235B602_9BACL|nr:DUF4244 domain-containing protein [Paludifilum halophilum]OYD07409.1 hypothetical protein CHM34_10895 [Paludifilum halophilum]